ncbi:MAG: hypothetical protein HY851_09850, partial [candidate division Zixibacteria bacterium]|nr:hypothetical protein [candidate division Zixibacteria bacterium]
MNYRLCLAGLLIVSVTCGCVSRYRLALHLSVDNMHRQVKVEQTQLVLDARLGDPFGEQKILSGS